MTREEIYKFIFDISEHYNKVILELPTSFGKSKASLDLLNKWGVLYKKVLYVFPTYTIKDSFEKEILRWYPNMSGTVYATTYNSLHKHANTHWDAILLDEVHHLTEARSNVLKCMKYDHLVGMSATLGPKFKNSLYNTIGKHGVIKADFRDAIDSGVLPDPKVIMIPMSLDNSDKKNIFELNKESNIAFTVNETNINKYFGNRSRNIRCLCSDSEYYRIISEYIDYRKMIYEHMSTKFNKNLWMRPCNERLKFLSRCRENIVADILDILKDYRTITFCSTIKQAEALGKNNITSKNADALNVLDAFNNKKIKHITSVNMCNEGINITDCKIGIFAHLSASEIQQAQRLGRIIRAKDPVIIIPYFTGTRDEEIVDDMRRSYNENLIHYCNDVSKIKELL